MNRALKLGLAATVVAALMGCEFIEIDSCLDRGGSWDAESKRCSIDTEVLGGGLDVSTVLVVDSSYLRGKRVTLSGNLTDSNLLCSAYEPEHCLVVDLVGADAGNYVTLSGTFTPPSPDGSKGRLDKAEIASIVQDTEN